MNSRLKITALVTTIAVCVVAGFAASSVLPDSDASQAKIDRSQEDGDAPVSPVGLSPASENGKPQPVPPATAEIPKVASWTRPYKQPTASTLDVPFSVPVSDLKQMVLKSIREPLDEGTEVFNVTKEVEKVKKVIEEGSEIQRVLERVLHIRFVIRGFPPHIGPEPVWKEMLVNKTVPFRRTVEKIFWEKVQVDVNVSRRIVARKDSITVEMHGKKLDVSMSLDYSVSTSLVHYGPILIAPPSRADGRIHLSFTRNLEWTNDGKLVLKDGGATVRLDPRGSLLSLPHISMDKIIKANVLLEILKGPINNELQLHMGDALLDLESKAKDLPKAISLSENLRLLLRPQELTPWEVTSDGKVATTGLSMTLLPRIEGAEEDLPKLDMPKITAARAGTNKKSSRLELEVVLTQAQVSARLAKLVEGEAGRLPRSISIGKPRMQPAGDAQEGVGGKAALGRVLVEVPLTVDVQQREPLVTSMFLSGTLCFADGVVWLEKARCQLDPGAELALALFAAPDLKDRIRKATAAIEVRLNKERLDLGAICTKSIPKSIPLGNLSVTITDAKVNEVYVGGTDIRLVIAATCSVESPKK